MNYPDSLEYLETLTNLEKEKSFEYPEAMSLDRMRRLVKSLGNPQKAYPSIIIAGSKGKGSVAAILSSILRMENLKVGLYTSPHLSDVRERIRVNGLEISETRFAEYLTPLSKMLDEYSWRKDMPTYFEVLTALAFVHFKEMKVQVAILEVGLGGLYDSTNIAEAKVVGMTPISLEHTDKLGKTISKIAVQKCGVIKGREHVVSAAQSREAEGVITETALEREAKLFWLGREVKLMERNHGPDFQKLDVKTPFGSYYDLTLHLLGEHQMENAAQAIAMAGCFEDKTRIKISPEAVKQGVRDARWPGRLEKISDHPQIVVDGAHNRESMRRMLLGLRRHFHFTRLLVVLGVSQDKDLAGILEELLPETDQFYVTQSGHDRSLACEKISEAIEGLGKKSVMDRDFQTLFSQACHDAGDDDLVLVTGSLYLVALARKKMVEN